MTMKMTKLATLATALSIVAICGGRRADANAPIYNTDVELTASDTALWDGFGMAVSIAGDIAIVGAETDDDDGYNSGAVYVFERNATGTNAWGEVGKLTASDASTNDYFGCSVSIDGDLVLIGAFGNDDAGDSSGSAYVFDRSLGEMAKLTASDAGPSEYFGHAVSIAGDVALVAAHRDGDKGYLSGSVYVFERNAGGPNAWGQVAKLNSSVENSYDLFGYSVAVAGDVAAIGAYHETHSGQNYAGAAYVFERNADGTNAWGEVARLAAPTPDTDDEFGNAVAVAGDTVVVGSRGDNDNGTNSGSAYVFARNAGGTNAWGQVTKLTASDGVASNYFGESVAVNGDVVVVGTPHGDDDGNEPGVAYVFERNEGGPNAWGQVRKLVPPGSLTGDEFGWSVAIDGDVALVGGPSANGGVTNSGSVYAFPVATRTKTFVETDKLGASDGAADDGFGLSVAMAGDVAVVSSVGDDDAGESSGSVYVFERDPGPSNAWNQVAKLGASDAVASNYFGKSVAAAGDVALIGSPRSNDAGSNSGSAYVFERGASGVNAWGQVAKLTASDAATNDYFGSSVSVAGHVALVGAYGNDDIGLSSGSAYLFERNATGTNAWGQVKKLTAPDAAGGDQFGASVAVANDIALVGAPNDDDVLANLAQVSYLVV